MVTYRKKGTSITWKTATWIGYMDKVTHRKMDTRNQDKTQPAQTASILASLSPADFLPVPGPLLLHFTAQRQGRHTPPCKGGPHGESRTALARK